MYLDPVDCLEVPGRSAIASWEQAKPRSALEKMRNPRHCSFPPITTFSVLFTVYFVIPHLCRRYGESRLCLDSRDAINLATSVMTDVSPRYINKIPISVDRDRFTHLTGLVLRRQGFDLGKAFLQHARRIARQGDSLTNHVFTAWQTQCQAMPQPCATECEGKLFV